MALKNYCIISHKHNDLDEIKGLIGLKIKQGIKRCNKFILLTTNWAVESKWYNWKFGYGDAQKFDTRNIVLFSVKPEKAYDYWSR